MDEQNQSENCGSFQTGSTALGIPIFISLFYMSNVQSYIHFQVPDKKQYLDFGKKELCFGYNSFDFANSVIRDLYDFGQIDQPVTFLTLNKVLQNQNTDEIIGQIDIGQPNMLSIRDGEQLAILKSVINKNFYFAVASNQKIQFLGSPVKLSTENVSFKFNSPYYAISSETYFYIVKQLKENKIDYLIEKRQIRNKEVQDSQMISVSDITKLSDIQVELIKEEDNTTFTVIIKPSQYTRKLDVNKYELLFDTYLGVIDFSLGNTIFETYYIGFNQANGKVLIAERSIQNIHQQHV
ncbi:hypothetical protein TTHERM_00131130 (macronuclear) [Tetrahymena thermophila SB210]|uniref:Uncharacterized protein n=1 Tax=Tetrahymena thermophila (strain SB210) TaxID=312017 RepID=I7MKI7_TETTS|nr:hypothetical protein TTHERM_00131130 [Tetrahymena thermophila SB210]EAR99345.2 hypothetical protein TTHERM_00131130 [Tetrahymena thermophila SB210]|eukprot:XP_001019590.2 hypothetical protein TTHERM_00131130 [Tetrahymena thermophila SB210]